MDNIIRFKLDRSISLYLFLNNSMEVEDLNLSGISIT